jgi:hypothetical protein
MKRSELKQIIREVVEEAAGPQLDKPFKKFSGRAFKNLQDVAGSSINVKPYAFRLAPGSNDDYVNTTIKDIIKRQPKRGGAVFSLLTMDGDYEGSPAAFLVNNPDDNEIAIVFEDGSKSDITDLTDLEDTLRQLGYNTEIPISFDYSKIKDVEALQDERYNTGRKGLTQAEAAQTPRGRAISKKAASKADPLISEWFDSLVENRESIIDAISNFDRSPNFISAKEFFEMIGMPVPPTLGTIKSELASKTGKLKRNK